MILARVQSSSTVIYMLQHNYSEAELHNDDVGEESIDYQDEDDAFNVANNEDNAVKVPDNGDSALNVSDNQDKDDKFKMAFID